MNSNLQNLWEEVRELSFGTIPQIDRLHTPPNPLQFLRHYLSQNKPFILSASTATTLRWPATTLWTSTPYLLQTLSSSTVSLHLTPTGHADSLTPHPSNPNSLCFASAHVTRTSFPDAIDAIQNNNGFVGYAQQQNDCFREEYGALAGDCDSDISWVTEAIGGLPEAVNLWIGNELSETSFHKDHYENLYAVVTGEKHFVLLPPTDVHRMYVREYPAAQYNYSRETGEFKLEIENPQRNVPWCSVNPYPLPENKEKEMSNFPLYFNGPKPFEITVKAGEILYLPSMWFHHVRQTPDSRGLTIAVNYWYDMQFDIKYAYFNFLQSLPTPLQPASHDPLTNENASRPIKQSNTSSSKNPSTPVSASDDRNFNINDEDKDDEVNLEDDGVQELARPSGRRSKNKGENVADSSSKRVEEGTREDVFQLNDMFGCFEIESKERHTPIRVNANANARLADSYGLRQVERDI